MRGPQEVQPVAWKLVELQPGQPDDGQPIDDPALSWLAQCDSGDAWEKYQWQQGEGEEEGENGWVG